MSIETRSLINDTNEKTHVFFDRQSYIYSVILGQKRGLHYLKADVYHCSPRQKIKRTLQRKVPLYLLCRYTAKIKSVYILTALI